MLVACAYLVDTSSPWVLQSLFLTAIGEARERGLRGLEAFSYRYSEGGSSYERFRVHRTVFPQDFLADFGFRVLRSAGRVGLSRLELGGLQPVVEGTREKVLRVVKDAFGVPEPVPVGRGLEAHEDDVVTGAELRRIAEHCGVDRHHRAQWVGPAPDEAGLDSVEIAERQGQRRATAGLHERGRVGLVRSRYRY